MNGGVDCAHTLNYTWKIVSSGMLRRVTLVRTDFSEEPSATIIRVTRIGDVGASLAVTSKSISSDSCHPNDGGGKFLRNVGFYTCHTE
jgi:hypothetical protein